MNPNFPNASDSFKKSNPHIFVDNGGDYSAPSAAQAQEPADPPPSKADLKSEKQLQIQIEQYLGHKGITCIRSRMDRATTNDVGTPDFLFAVDGQACAYEAKLPHRKLSPTQEKKRKQLEEDGWHYVVIHDLDMVISDLHFLRKIPY